MIDLSPAFLLQLIVTLIGIGVLYGKISAHMAQTSAAHDRFEKRLDRLEEKHSKTREELVVVDAIAKGNTGAHKAQTS